MIESLTVFNEPALATEFSTHLGPRAWWISSKQVDAIRALPSRSPADAR